MMNKKGQTMILTVLLLSGAILSATTISALLVLYQLRQVSDIRSSTQAIFAADSGLECVLYEIVVNGSQGEAIEGTCVKTLDNGASYRVTYEGGDTYKSVGEVGERGRRTARALEISF